MISSRSVDEKKLERRRTERLTDLPVDLQRRLELNVPVIYYLNGEPIKEYPNGRRFVVRLLDDGCSEIHVREVLSTEEKVCLQKFVDDPDGAVAQARAFGTDVSQTIRNALLTPEERWRRANATIAETQRLFGAVKRGRTRSA